MSFKISIRQNRTLPFCNKDRLIADDTKEYELRRQRFDNDALNPNELALAEELEMEQVFLRLKQNLSRIIYGHIITPFNYDYVLLLYEL